MEQTGEVMNTQIDFVGFADDCRVEGTVDLDEDARLADMLNRRPTIVVHGVTVVSTLDGHTQQLDELEIDRDELDLVVASGPRGDPKRRLATKPSGVTMKLGPYSAVGFMHGPPTSNPLSDIGRRQPMVAMTDVVLEYQFCAEAVSEWHRTLLVNRQLAMSLRAVANPVGLQPGAA